MRRLIGITGAPGAGKSTYAARLAEQLSPAAIVVPMDGFHLAGRELDRLGRADRKGAPDTFDVDGYVDLLARLRCTTSTVYAPEFRRDIEEPIAGAIAVEAHHTTVITEGNYLLLDGRRVGTRPPTARPSAGTSSATRSSASPGWSNATWRTVDRPTRRGAGSSTPTSRTPG